MLKGFNGLGGVEMIRWCRMAAMHQRVGRGVVASNEMQELLIALAVLARRASVVAAHPNASLELDGSGVRYSSSASRPHRRIYVARLGRVF